MHWKILIITFILFLECSFKCFSSLSFNHFNDEITQKNKYILYDSHEVSFEETVPNTETLKLKFNIPQEFVPEIESPSKLSYHLRYHLSIFDNVVNSLENYISVLTNVIPASNLLLFTRNCFIEHAARYILYEESRLGHKDEKDTFEAIEIIQEISPSLDLKVCSRALFEWAPDDEGLFVGSSPLMFSSIYEILKIMRQNDNATMQENIDNFRQHLKDLKIFRRYFDISEHLRVTLPMIEKIRKLKTPNANTEEEELITILNSLLCINENVPYKFQTLDLSSFVSKKKKLLSNRNHSAHALVPWMMLRNLGLVSVHATSPIFKDVLFLPQNRQILHEALPMIVEESEHFIGLIEKFIILEIKAALREDVSIEIADDAPSFPSISLLSNYGADAAYLHKIIRIFENFDFNCVPSIHVILRLMDILGEISKNLSPTIASLNPDFWNNLKRLRDSGQHGLSFQRRLVKALEEEKSIIPLVLKDFSELFDFAKHTLDVFPKDWSSLQNFYKAPQTNLIRIEGKGVDKLMSMLYPLYLTIDDKEELINTADLYINPEDSLLLVRAVIERKRPIDENIKQKEFTANVDNLPVSKNTKKKLNEAYKTIKTKGFLGNEEEEHEKKSEDLLKTLTGIKILTSEEVRYSLKKLTEKDDRGGTVFNDATTFKYLEAKLQEIGIIDPKIIKIWQDKWEKIRKPKNNEHTKKEKDKSTDDVRTIIQNSVIASEEILKFLKMIHDVLGGASGNREIFFKDQNIALSVEHHLTMIRHYLGFMQEANNYVNRHDMNDPDFFKIIKFFWEIEGKVKEFSMMGNAFAHLHDVTHQANIESGSHGRNWVNWRNITLFLDGIWGLTIIGTKSYSKAYLLLNCFLIFTSFIENLQHSTIRTTVSLYFFFI
ncbi:MAG: hypothetical protein J0H12_06645 [Candidatus Paracaedimonas acanthamoebae]|uniref:Uncharacterized protein n=1 Tax=Candidatus Paracaedimonas acanthamoebae TaxID=244581 RepID=A0A8J7Q1H0_9PROT|nr:hypothetical protein [Holosporales bacterium]MBN9413581.1 hypothetical protein [Candidatus Paracaedimonas acanthamoebae]OJX02554.1 MAG: hypothetical protein BGO76_06680 [Caedibacter sp. 38-128]